MKKITLSALLLLCTAVSAAPVTTSLRQVGNICGQSFYANLPAGFPNEVAFVHINSECNLLVLQSGSMMSPKRVDFDSLADDVTPLQLQSTKNGFTNQTEATSNGGHNMSLEIQIFIDAGIPYLKIAYPEQTMEISLKMEPLPP